jgi:hypothetical protein
VLSIQRSAVIAEILPEPQKRKQIDGAKENYPNFANLFVSEPYNGEFEKVADELLTVIDGDSVE